MLEKKLWTEEKTQKIRSTWAHEPFKLILWKSKEYFCPIVSRMIFNLVGNFQLEKKKLNRTFMCCPQIICLSSRQTTKKIYKDRITDDRARPRPRYIYGLLVVGDEKFLHTNNVNFDRWQDGPDIWNSFKHAHAHHQNLLFRSMKIRNEWKKKNVCVSTVSSFLSFSILSSFNLLMLQAIRLFRASSVKKIYAIVYCDRSQ